MTEIEMSSEITVKLIRQMASDEAVVQAAQVSVLGENNPKTDMPRLINYLMESRHGSPFEHNAFTFFVEAPIFTIREWQRHRISSFNEMSGRYSIMKPKFYTPDHIRLLTNIGTSARPEMAAGTEEQKLHLRLRDQHVAKIAWAEYERSIQSGISNELARTILPLSIYTQMYWTVNARSLMNFLSLRVMSENSLHISRPQREIEMGAEQVEKYFHDYMPRTHEAFVKHGRVAP